MENKIKYYRTIKGFTQSEMANLLHVTRNTYLLWEKGITECSFEALKKISQILSTSIDDLLDNPLYPSSRDNRTNDLIKEIEEAINKHR